MKKFSIVVGLCLMVCVLSACGKKDNSPQIVCNVDGKIVPTAFTFEAFRLVLASEQGRVEATGFTQLKTRSLTISFKPLEDGTVLAERVFLPKFGKEESPALLFGLKKAGSVITPVLPLETSSSNAPAVAPAAE
jgi:hypothetical protein